MLLAEAVHHVDHTRLADAAAVAEELADPGAGPLTAENCMPDLTHPTGAHEHEHEGGAHEHDHHSAHDNHGGHGHSHGLVDRSIVRSREGIRAVAISLAVLGVAAGIQTLVFIASGSVALLADLIHTFGDALTAIPLSIRRRIYHAVGGSGSSRPHGWMRGRKWHWMLVQAAIVDIVLVSRLLSSTYPWGVWYSRRTRSSRGVRR